MKSVSHVLGKLQVLDLTFCTTLTDDAISRISFFCKRLKYLDISLCYKITDDSMASLQDIENLEGVVISGCNKVTDEGIEKLLKQSKVTTLRFVDLSWCRKLTSHCLINGVSYLENLTSIILINCENIDDDGVICISENCTKLKVFEVENCTKLTDNSLVSMSTHCSHLTILNLDCIENITDKGVFSLCKNCTELKILELEDAQCITTNGFGFISTFCKNMVSLSLNGCSQITERCVEDIALNCVSLQLLDIGECERIRFDINQTISKCNPNLLVCHNIGHTSTAGKDFYFSEQEIFRNKYKDIRRSINQNINPYFKAFNCDECM